MTDQHPLPEHHSNTLPIEYRGFAGINLSSAQMLYLSMLQLRPASPGLALAFYRYGSLHPACLLLLLTYNPPIVWVHFLTFSSSCSLFLEHYDMKLSLSVPVFWHLSGHFSYTELPSNLFSNLNATESSAPKPHFSPPFHGRLEAVVIGTGTGTNRQPI